MSQIGKSGEVMPLKDEEIDLTAEISRLREQVIHLKKMAALGDLTAAVSHEIRNPLSFIKNFSELSEELLASLQESIGSSSDETAAHLLEYAAKLEFNLAKISENCDRATETLERMLGYSRKRCSRLQSTELHLLLNEFLSLVYTTSRARYPDFKVRFEKRYDDGIGTVEVIPGDLSRVFVNLFNNAFHAMRVKKDELGGDYSPRLLIETAKSEDLVTIRIRDNGLGIRKGHLDAIFQPFFTTRTAPDASGLGLSICKELMAQHGGEIKVKTQVGKFTEFTLFLPVGQGNTDGVTEAAGLAGR